jgi:hypothetical protein
VIKTNSELVKEPIKKKGEVFLISEKIKNNNTNTITDINNKNKNKTKIIKNEAINDDWDQPREEFKRDPSKWKYSKEELLERRKRLLKDKTTIKKK